MFIGARSEVKNSFCSNDFKHKCKSWEWAEPELCDRAKKIIPGLLDNIKEKDEEIKSLTMRMKHSQRKRTAAPFLCGLGLGFLLHIAMYVFMM
ncbi:hypothetical protein DM860_013766 [Cuscuta australis]|uniref:Uncharacterized protein n=1 Tax=Cuscuta australis TaxID=267555 RepID=A0A328DJE7_9ASTE|nr:hypothetical protein DM860_013766 [Cuscuta australis]